MKAYIATLHTNIIHEACYFLYTYIQITVFTNPLVFSYCYFLPWYISIIQVFYFQFILSCTFYLFLKLQYFNQNYPIPKRADHSNLKTTEIQKKKFNLN